MHFEIITGAVSTGGDNVRFRDTDPGIPAERCVRLRETSCSARRGCTGAGPPVRFGIVEDRRGRFLAPSGFPNDDNFEFILSRNDA